MSRKGRNGKNLNEFLNWACVTTSRNGKTSSSILNWPYVLTQYSVTTILIKESQNVTLLCGAIRETLEVFAVRSESV